MSSSPWAIALNLHVYVFGRVGVRGTGEVVYGFHIKENIGNYLWYMNHNTIWKLFIFNKWK